MLKRMIGKIRCWLKHDWTYTEGFQSRLCLRCERREVIFEYLYDAFRRGRWVKEELIKDGKA